MDGQILGWQVGGFVKCPVPASAPPSCVYLVNLDSVSGYDSPKTLGARWGVESQAKEDMGGWLQLLTFNQKNHFSC